MALLPGWDSKYVYDKLLKLLKKVFFLTPTIPAVSLCTCGQPVSGGQSSNSSADKLHDLT